MRTQFSRLSPTAALALAIAFTISCSSDNGGNNDPGGSSSSGGDNNGGLSSPSGGGTGVPFDENSQVYNEDGTPFTGSGVLKLGKTSIDVKVGNVTNGIVNLQLPATIPNEVLGESGAWANDDGFLLTNSNGDKIGYMFPLYLLNGRLNNVIWYYYFSNAVKINDERTTSSGKVNKTNIDAKAGWNTIYYVDNGNGTELSTNNILTKEVRWTLDN